MEQIAIVAGVGGGVLVVIVAFAVVPALVNVAVANCNWLLWQHFEMLIIWVVLVPVGSVLSYFLAI